MNYNNGSAYTFTWQNGRELATATVNGITSSYTYNSDGLRTRKVVGNKVYDYYWFGSQLAMMTITSGSSVMTLKFYYDANGLPIIFDYNGTQYHYITNLQGDVVGLANEYGIVATYAYDAWGKIISTSGITSMEESALAANPLRYRGYIYDTETGFYYLQSRYYDPEIGRFFNADACLYNTILGFNLFAYCYNNPVNYSDPYGESATAALAGWASSSWVMTLVDGLLPIGDIIYVGGCIIFGGVVLVETVILADTIGNIVSEGTDTPDSTINEATSNKNERKGPKGKPGRKKQGREVNERKKSSSKWENRGNKDPNRPMKKHTPGRDHRHVFFPYADEDDQENQLIIRWG